MFHYRVTFFVEVDESTVTDAGVLSANDFIEAVDVLVRYFGNDLVSINYLAPINDVDAPIVSFEEIDQLDRNS